MNGQRAVRLGDGRQVALGAYVAAWKKAKANPDQIFNRTLIERWPANGGEIVRQFRAGMQDRINRHDPAFKVGRKWHHDWQRHALQLAGRVNTPRLIVREREVPAEFRARLAERIYRDDDF